MGGRLARPHHHYYYDDFASGVIVLEGRGRAPICLFPSLMEALAPGGPGLPQGWEWGWERREGWMGPLGKGTFLSFSPGWSLAGWALAPTSGAERVSSHPHASPTFYLSGLSLVAGRSPPVLTSSLDALSPYQPHS